MDTRIPEKLDRITLVIRWMDKASDSTDNRMRGVAVADHLLDTYNDDESILDIVVKDDLA